MTDSPGNNLPQSTTSDFVQQFRALTGNLPLSWQKRLYCEHFINGELPPVIDLPTGLGKTMVMAIWLIARSEKDSKLPRRLIYVVDRRTVVDQATDLAMNLRDRFGKARLSISTLRGQLADNREWSQDPSRLAIIIGTVDLIGSGLLFSGYRSGYKRRPLEAGLLGQDSLLVLDEAHLSKPFEKLIRAIGDDGLFQKNRDAKAQGKPMGVIRMSATSSNLTDSKPPFTLQFDANWNLSGEDAKDTTITDRFGAGKRLTIIPLGEKEQLADELAQNAIDLIAPSNPEQKPVVGQRIVVFTRRPDAARSIAEAIRKHGAKKNSRPYAEAVGVLTGTMRGLERDELVEKPVFKERWLNGFETG
jgi:CRISPR-associated endonuclease/helicase Cas3